MILTGGRREALRRKIRGLVYWPMLKAGDVDELKPQLEMYRRTLSSPRWPG